MTESGIGRSASLSAALGGAVVRVGTMNPAKLGAVEIALRRLADHDTTALDLQTSDVTSDVPEQPIGWEEIVAGARNRARAAFALGDCVLAVGIEDGLVRLAGGDPDPAASSRDYFNIGCAWVTDGEREGHGFSSGFAYPPDCLVPAVEGQEPIGDLFDAFWRRARPHESATDAPSGRGGGNIGRLTEGRLDRSDYGSHAVLCALVRFLQRDLYD